jgi:hypothetical protein
MTLHLNISKGRNTSGVWTGMPIDEALRQYQKIYSWGTLSSLHYGVWLEPFDEDGK